jgi:hypothetical protein
VGGQVAGSHALLEAVQGLVLGLRGANAQQVVQGVRARLAELAPLLPAGVKTEVFYDRGNLVKRAVGTVAKALLEAIVLVVLLAIIQAQLWWGKGGVPTVAELERALRAGRGEGWRVEVERGGERQPFVY